MKPNVNWRRGAWRLWVAASVLWSATGIVWTSTMTTETVSPPTVIHVKFSDTETWDYPSEWGGQRIRQDLERRVAALHKEELDQVEKMPEVRKAACRAIPSTTPFADQPEECVKLFFSRDELVVPTGWESQLPTTPVPIFRIALVVLGPPLLILIVGTLFIWAFSGFSRDRTAASK
jgi:hypothetical protein